MSEDPQIVVRDVAWNIRRHGLLPPGCCAVVGVSGGPDSVALLDILHHLTPDLGWDLHVAHFDHQLRGRDSDGDRTFVETLSRDRRLTCHTGREDVAASASAGQSLEEAGREARRTFLQQVAADLNADRIVLGHHLDDQAETVLMRLTRGAGLTGLAGIRPIAEGLWIRPLLEVSHDRLLAYCRNRGVVFRTDATNEDERYLRNRIRKRGIPHLKTLVSGAVPAVIARTAGLLRDDDAFVQESAVDAFKAITYTQTERKLALDGSLCFGYHIAIQRRLFRLAAGALGVDIRHLPARRVDRALERMSQGHATLELAPDLTACFDGRLIIFGRPVEPFEDVLAAPGVTTLASINAHLKVTSLADRPVDPRQVDPFSVYFDAEGVDDLSVRSIRPGDRMQPFGAAGTTKLHDILIDRKIPRILRDEVPVVTNNGRPVWIVGVRAAQFAPISYATRQALRVEFQGDWRRLSGALQRRPEQNV